MRIMSGLTTLGNQAGIVQALLMAALNRASLDEWMTGITRSDRSFWVMITVEELWLRCSLGMR